MKHSKAETIPAASFVRRHSTIAGLALIVVAAFVGLAAADRADRLAVDRVERAAMIKLASESARDMLDQYDRLLALLVDPGAAAPAEVAQNLLTQNLPTQNLLTLAPTLNPGIAAAALFDEGGAVLARAPSRVAAASFDAISAEVQAAMTGAPRPAFHATRAVRDPDLGGDVIGLARIRRAADGNFAGMALIVVDPASLIPLQRLPQLASGGSLALERDDGTVLHHAGGHLATATGDGASVSGYPLAIHYQSAPDEIALAWRTVWLRNGALVGGVGIVVALGAALRDRRRRRMAARAAERRAQEALARQQDVVDLAAAASRADQANRAKSRFFAQVTHELRTPLNAILGFSETIRREMFGPVANPRYVEYAGLINDAGSHLLSLINDLLDMSKLEEGRMEIAPIRVSAAALARSTLDLVELLARERDVALVLSGIDTCPDLNVDPRAAKQVLINLLSNAVKFTPAGGRIDLRLAGRPDGGVVITVADTGIGMNAEGVRLAFEPFGQVAGEFTARTSGTGLGLPIARALMRLHGGELTLASKPGGGTIATAIFPAEAAAQGEAPALSAVRAA